MGPGGGVYRGVPPGRYPGSPGDDPPGQEGSGFRFGRPEEPSGRGLFGGVFARSGADTGDVAWLQAMLDAEAGLARALERAGLAPAGSGEAVTDAAQADHFRVDELGELAALTGNPVPGLARALARRVPQPAARAVHQGATSQDILDTAAMLLARRVIAVVLADLANAAAAAAALADEHRSTIMIGRTLLQQAVPVTFGLVAAGWLTAWTRPPTVWPRSARGGWPCSSAARRARWPRSVTKARGSRRCSPRNWAWPCPSCPGTRTGCGSSTWPPRWPASRRSSARSPVTSRCSPSPRSARSVRAAAHRAPTDAASPRRGGSSAMPHKHNPVAAIAILGCTRQVPGLLATLVACAEQEHQRAAGAWHAEWEPLTALLRLTASAAGWAAELLPGLVVDAPRMAANLAATKDLPLAEHVTSLLAGVLGGAQAHDLVAEAAQRAVSAGLPLRDVLLAVPKLEGRLASAGVTAEQVESALEPAGYLGAADAFITAALAAHEALDAHLSEGDDHG